MAKIARQSKPFLNQKSEGAIECLSEASMYSPYLSLQQVCPCHRKMNP